jgi:hypothetical protein
MEEAYLRMASALRRTAPASMGALVMGAKGATEVCVGAG